MTSSSEFRSKMASFFHGNPFSSPVGQRIERATDGGLSSEDWTLNIEICDIINETDEGPKDAVKAIRKRLSVANKNYKSVLLTLTVLETCVKNCGHRFHSLIAKKDFLDELTKIINPKNTPPQIVQDKILGLIQNWSDAFRGSPDLVAVVHTYDALKAQGFEFPAQDLDTLAPIYTPQRSVPEAESRPATASAQQPTPTQPMAAAAPVPVIAQPPAMLQQAGPIHPTPEQLAKLRSELDTVQGNVTVMSEMLTELTPGQEELGDLELLQELNRTCRAMQSRLLELLEKVANEEVIGELLRINDDLNNVFIRYDRYERFRQASQPQSQQATPVPAAEAAPAEPPRPILTATPISPPRPTVPATSLPAAAPPSVTPATDSLISFDEDTQSTRPAVTDVPTIQRTQAQPQIAAPAAQDDEFDMFAQSRSSNMEESRKAGSSYSDNLQPFDRSISSAMSVANNRADSPPKPAAQENQTPRQTSAQTGNQQGVAIESIETWLDETNLNDSPAPAAAAPSAQGTMSSSEFDDFLAERAAAGGQRTGSVKGNSRPRQRQMQMSDTKAEDELFGL